MNTRRPDSGHRRTRAPGERSRERVDAVYRAESRQVLATLTIALAAGLLAGCAAAAGARARQIGEWPAYARDPGGMRHSPLTQVTRDNVARLEVAWTYRTGELAMNEGTTLARKAAFEATPLMVDGVLYFSTPTNRVIALDAATGQERWVHDPKLDLTLDYSEVTSRGVATWVDATRRAGQAGHRRLYMGTIDGRLLALDAGSGRPVEAFGAHGIVDLKADAGAVLDGQYQVTSPPAVVGDLVIVGNAYGDNQAVETPRGIVRAYDARSGVLRWSWDPVPRDPSQRGYETWRGPLAHRTGSANAWPPMSVDSERDLVFVPTTSASPDYYGGERRGANLFANCVVALRASIVSRTYLLDFQRGGIPTTKPPWGTLAAVNLRTASLQFEVPLGSMLDPAVYPEAEQWGSLSLGGPMTTAAGLIFIGATRDNHLRAFDIDTGRLLWKASLPAGAHATPMTYEVGGAQYVVIASGGHGKLGSTLGDYVIAYALPRALRR